MKLWDGLAAARVLLRSASSYTVSTFSSSTHSHQPASFAAQLISRHESEEPALQLSLPQLFRFSPSSS